MRSLFLRNAFPFTPFRTIANLLLSPSAAVNCPTVCVSVKHEYDTSIRMPAYIE